MSINEANAPGEDRGWRYEPLTGPFWAIRTAVDALFSEGDIVELRAFSGKSITSAYFDDLWSLAWMARQLDRHGHQLFVTLNEIDPALRARVSNNLQSKHEATTDRGIVRRRWLLIDVDPVRPSGVCSTTEEKIAAKNRAQEVAKYLCRQQGWPDPVAVDSGNGYHLLFRIDQPNDDESREMVRSTLEALAAMFDDGLVKIDTSVHNASRLIRLPGTVNRKGTNTPARPHRRSRILEVKKEAE